MRHNQIRLEEQIFDTDSKLDELAEFTFPKAADSNIEISETVETVETVVGETKSNTDIKKTDGETTVVKQVDEGKKCTLKKCGGKVKGFLKKVYQALFINRLISILI